MTASQPNNEAIFHAARDISDRDRRREFVREACGHDQARIAQVEALLAAAEGPDSLLDIPTAGTPVTTIDQITTERRGTVIGPYKLIEPIGEGGMGSVWMAQQTQPVKRLVAIKLIKAGMDSKQVIARFEAERQALALMDHPNIAKVLDGGTTSAGRPFFVMDLVKGVPITRYCDEHHLTPRQRLELFLPVCQAIQHAHQKGIIHRDLKPNNVLVAPYDGKAVVKVIDFGVAKAAGQQLTDRTLVTGFGAIVGTLEYMSPEQAELNNHDIDTRSDIYTLGVLLYELLTGSPPFSIKELGKAGMVEMLRVIREKEPSKPSTKLGTAEGLPTLAANRGTEPAKLTALVRGELDWIVMKALEKDRNRRYETANGFAMDVQRYMADEPVLACPPSVGYRLRKFVRRNKGRVLATAALAVSILAGTAAVLTVEAKAERERAAVERERATRQAWTTASVAAAIREARERANEAWKVADYPDRMQRETDAAVAAVRRADEFVAGGTPTEETLAELASTREAVDDLARHTRLITARLNNLNQYADDGRNGALRDVELCTRHAAALREFGVDPVHSPADEVARTVAASRIRDPLLGMMWEWHWDATILLKLQQLHPDRAPNFPDANAVVVERLGRAIRSARQLCGGAYARWQDLLDRNDVPGLVAFAASPEALTFRSTLVAALAEDLRQASQYPAARTFLRAAVDRYPHDVGLRFDLWLVCFWTQPPDPAEALRHVSVACVLRPDSSLEYQRLGMTYAALGSYDHAIAAYRKSLALRPDSADTYAAMGETLLKKQDWEGAITAYREAVRLMPDDRLGHVGLGRALLAAGRHAEGLEVTLGALRQAPPWTEEPWQRPRYKAACAVMSCAEGKGATPLPLAERPAYRKQALELLTADLAATRKLVTTDRPLVHRMMGAWLGSEDLASVRKPKALDTLLPDERDAWNKLWGEVRELRDCTAPPTGSPQPEK
jgi:serine/threonine protein kinase/tetratricopeptide (TPR) repeat protein